MPDTNLGWDRYVEPDVQDPATVFEPPWGQSDEIELQKASNAATELEQKERSDEYDDETAAELRQKLNRHIIPLVKRKEAHVAKQQQTATQAALGLSAMERAREQMDMQHRAGGFVNTLVTDPQTGERFYQKQPGQWEQVQVAPPEPLEVWGEPGGRVEGAGEGSGEGAPMPMGPDGKPLTDQPRVRTVVGPDGAPRQQRIPTVAEYEAMRAATPEQQGAIAGQIGQGTFGQQQGPHTGGPMVIEQGGTRQEHQYGPDGRMTQRGERTMADGSPQPPQMQQPALDAPYRRALAELPPAPREFIPGPGGRPQTNRAFTKWMEAVQARAGDIAKEDRQTRREEETHRRDEFKAQQIERKANYGQSIKDEYQFLSDEVKRVRQANAVDPKKPTEPTESWMKDEDSMHREAVRRANRKMKILNPDWSPPGEKPGDQPAAEKPAEKKSSTVAQIKAALEVAEAREAAERAAANPPSPLNVPMPDVDPQTGTRTMSRFR